MDRTLVIDPAGYLHLTYYSDRNSTSEIYYAKSDQPVGGSSAGTCAAPIPIACGSVIGGDNAGYSNNISSYSCSTWDETGPEVIYQYTLDPGSNYTVTATLTYWEADVDIFLLSSGGCDSGQCMGTIEGGNSMTAYNVTPGDYYISVDGYSGATSPYTFTLTCTPKPSAISLLTSPPIHSLQMGLQPFHRIMSSSVGAVAIPIMAIL